MSFRVFRASQHLDEQVRMRFWEDERPYTPTRETSPRAIARAQRRAIRDAMRTVPDATPEQLSDVVDLPVSVVTRRLAELVTLAERWNRWRESSRYADTVVSHGRCERECCAASATTPPKSWGYTRP